MSISTPDQLDYVQVLTFQDHLCAYLFDKDASYGTFFDYMEYMWSLKDEPNILILHFEDIKRVSELSRSIQWAGVVFLC